MKLRCPRSSCILGTKPDQTSGLIIRKGSFFRKSDSRYVSRFFCRSCGKGFSKATGKPSAHQKRRRITPLLFELMSSGISQRRCAKHLGVNRKTVVRRFRFLAEQERLKHGYWLNETYAPNSIEYVQFDDLETSEHTKCKPLSVALAVDPKTRRILSFKVNQMPAKGLLAKVAFRKYGYRRDQRSKGWNEMMKELIPLVSQGALFRSDSNPHYPKYLFKHHQHAAHETTLGGRGAVTGQGELKKLNFDPLFALNHTCAMLRANVSRLFRRTWCTTKNRQGLIDHLWIYVGYHNRVLTCSQAHGKGPVRR